MPKQVGALKPQPSVKTPPPPQDAPKFKGSPKQVAIYAGRIHTVGMGKVVLAAGERGGNEVYAKARRVDIKLLSPQS